MGKTLVPDQIRRLVERYEQDKLVFQSPQFKEEQLRLEFLNPFFEALGWDVYNRQGLSETFKQVIHEESIRLAGATKAPDYTFRIGGRRVFFVEAKKPAVKVAEEISPAYQLRRYGWTAKLPVSILTDFEEFAVYDCRIKPQKNDKAAVARVMFLTYQDYLTRWQELVELFSPDAIQRGSLERFLASTKIKKGTATVDKEFLAEISKWREILAKNIALRNPRLTNRELNFAVQRIIDRIIFLRICEDRGIETYGYLQSLLNGENIYDRLCDLFKAADDRYNSGLFHFTEKKGRAEEPDRLTLDLKIDDKPLKEIIASLYYPDSPYEFSVLPADILGQVYEQFLGKVIRLTKGHQAKVEDKPEVRKAGGVYYTPTYIVDYIVKNTVGKLVEGKIPAQVARLRILDPACGSGSFLLGAYQFLLDWHLDWYLKHHSKSAGPKSHLPIYQDRNGNWRLTTAERKRILLNNIYGVDIDAQAVEVTKLSLLLKVLEGENQETLQSQLRLYRERALPDLGSNIKCGNSLIGPDFYHNRQMNLFDEEERLRINVFDWNEAFPEIMKSGGFDAVIGNPPYVSFGLRGAETIEKGLGLYLREHYPHSAEYKLSTYAIFIDRGISLLKDCGMLSFIVPDSFLLGRYFSKLRRYILDTGEIKEIILFQKDFWKAGVVGLPVIFVVKRQSNREKRSKNKLTAKLCASLEAFAKDDFKFYSYEQSYFDRVCRNRFRLFFDKKSKEFTDNFEQNSIKLGKIVSIHTGVRSKIGQKNIVSPNKKSLNWKRGLISGSEINRYQLKWAGNYINIDPKILWAGGWDPNVVLKEKLIMRQTGDSLIATYDDQKFYHLNNCHSVILKDKLYSIKFILGILNAKAINHFYHLVTLEKGRAMAQTDIETLEELPIRKIDFSNPKEKKLHDDLVKLVDKMLNLNKQLPKVKTPHEREVIKREIATTDRQIDQLVYELYGLTEEEIKIVEGIK